MSIALITGAAGLVGSEAVSFFHEKGFEIIGIDNNLRKFFLNSFWRSDYLFFPQKVLECNFSTIKR